MSLICRVSAMAATTMLINSISKRAFPSILLSHQNFLFPSHFSSLSSSSSSSSPSPSSDISHLAQATKNTVDILLKGVNDRSLVEEIKHILEMANRASLRREILHTNFLTPPTLNEAMAVLNKLVDVNAMSNGGYPEAERCRLSVGHVEILTTLPDTVAALSITGNFGFQPPTHGDFLGSILGTGIAREKLGDIILQGDKGAQVLIVPELVDYIISSLNKVGNVPVSCTMVPLEALEYEPPRLKTLRTVESSLRVDAIASAGFKISRSKFSELISKGDVRINWSTVTKNGATLKTGDLVSVSGQGRLKACDYCGFNSDIAIKGELGGVLCIKALVSTVESLTLSGYYQKPVDPDNPTTCMIAMPLEIGEINTTKRGKYAVELMRYL